MMPDPEENRLDQSLRSKFEQYAPPPTGKVWPGIAPHIGPPPLPRHRRRPLPLPFLFGLTALLAGLAGWLLPRGEMGSNKLILNTKTPLLSSKVALSGSEVPSLTSKVSVSNSKVPNLTSKVALPNSKAPNLSPKVFFLSSKVANRGQKMANRNPKRPNMGLESAVEAAVALQPLADTNATALNPSLSSAVVADSTPVTLRPLAALERQTLVQLPSIFTLNPGPPPAANRAGLIANLRTERAELFRLQRRTDSLLLALGDLPGAPLASPAVATTAPAADSLLPKQIKHRWSLLLTATPEQNTLNLQGPESDSLTTLRRNHETGRAGVSAALTAEYKLTPRLSVGGGVGYSSFGADLRITNKNTEVSVIYDSTTTHSSNVYTSTYQTHSIRIVQVPQLSPIFNGSGQVIRYDTVYVPRQDTVFSTIVQHDTTHTTRKVITPLISKKETVTTKLLQPTYRFVTLPVLLRYRLTTGSTSRWWADVSAGAQLQFFLGGTQVVTEDGEHFRTETITSGNGPFRALNVAFSGSLALNYALTNRLSLSVAPSMRWQALSLYKPETGLRQQPTATGLMFGVRFGL